VVLFGIVKEVVPRFLETFGMCLEGPKVDGRGAGVIVCNKVIWYTRKTYFLLARKMLLSGTQYVF